MTKIKVEFIGNANAITSTGCKSKETSCSSNSGCNNCKNGCNSKKNLYQVYEDLKSSFNNSDVKDNVIVEFIDISQLKDKKYDNIINYIKEGYEIPFIIIDGIVRYYGGVSFRMIYNDVKELLD